MNYILEIKAFYDKLEVKPLSTSAIALWHALMHTCNKTGWAEEFSVAVTVLSLKSGLSERSIRNARNELKTKGYIDFKSRSGNRSAIYKMLGLSATVAGNLSDKPSHNHDVPANNADNLSGNASGSVSDSSSGNASTLSKQNETKQNETKKEKEEKKKDRSAKPPVSPSSDSVNQIWNHYIQTFEGFFSRISLTTKRKQLINARLKDGLTVDDIKRAITNIRNSPFHCCQNDQGKFYADVTFICRSLDKVEEWMNYTKKVTPFPRKPKEGQTYAKSDQYSGHHQVEDRKPEDSITGGKTGWIRRPKKYQHL